MSDTEAHDHLFYGMELDLRNGPDWYIVAYEDREGETEVARWHEDDIREAARAGQDAALKLAEEFGLSL